MARIHKRALTKLDIMQEASGQFPEKGTYNGLPEPVQAGDPGIPGECGACQRAGTAGSAEAIRK